MLWSKDALGLSLAVEKGLGLEIQAGGWNTGSVTYQLSVSSFEELSKMGLKCLPHLPPSAVVKIQ